MILIRFLGKEQQPVSLGSKEYFCCFQFRREILQDLKSFSVETVGQVKMMASAIDAITEAPKELTQESQVKMINTLMT